MKAIRLSEHAKEQLRYRGASEEEVIETIRNSKWEAADLGRMQCQKSFSYNQEWNAKHYQTKQVKAIFVEEKSEIVVITVYVYYS